MNAYASALKTRREHAQLTVRALGDLIGRSPTFITDFELRKKSNPPEPEMMKRLADVLSWSEDEQLRAWGYELSHIDQRDNPFAGDDPRWLVVEKLKRIDLDRPGSAFVVRAVGELIDLHLGDPKLAGSKKPGGPLHVALDDMTHVREHKME